MRMIMTHGQSHLTNFISLIGCLPSDEEAHVLGIPASPPLAPFGNGANLAVILLQRGSRSCLLSVARFGGKSGWFLLSPINYYRSFELRCFEPRCSGN